MIERYQLRYFLAVVECGNFSRAAAQVNVTQPTLSAGIAKMERDLGSPVFHRNSQRVQLTENGTRILAHARSIESDFLCLHQQDGHGSAKRLIRLGILSTVPTTLVERIVRIHNAGAVVDTLELVEGSERELLARLDRGRIDLAVTLMRGSPRHCNEPLVHEGYALALPIWHQMASETAIHPRDLANEVMIVRRSCEMLSETSRHFTEHGVRPRFSFRSHNDDKVLAMVAAGLGITVMPDSYQLPSIVRPKLIGFDLKRNIGLLYGSHAMNLRDEPCAVVAAIRAAVQSLAGGSNLDP